MKLIVSNALALVVTFVPAREGVRGWGHSIVFLGETPYCHSSSLYPLYTGKPNTEHNSAMD